MTNARLLPLLAAALLAACSGGRGGSKPSSASSGPRPAWVEGESPRWPRAAYILGVGSADDEAAAADRARGEISRVFMAAVSVDTTVDESETTRREGGRESTGMSLLVAQTVKTSSNKALEGSEIVERWKDPAGRHYALAALAKDKALRAVDERTREVDADSVRWRDRFAAAADKLDRAKAAARLLALAKARTGLDADRRVLSGGTFPDASPAVLARDAAVAALAALDVVVVSSGDGADAVETGVVKGLVASGLTAKRGDAGTPGDLIVETSSALAPVEGGDPRWKWARATATVALKDARDGKQFARFEASDRQAAADPGEARRRVLASLAQKTAAQTASALAAYFTE